MRDVLRLIARSNSRSAAAGPPPPMPTVAFEAELRTWLRARDPGDAPIKLHLDVAKTAASTRQERSMPWRALRLASVPAVAAVVVWVAAMSLAQPAPLPHQPAASAPPTLDPTYFAGPWEPVGTVLAIPEAVALGSLVLIGLAIATIGARMAGVFEHLPGRARGRRTPMTQRVAIRRIIAWILTPILLLGLVPTWGVVVEEPLRDGGVSGTDSPLFLGRYPATAYGHGEIEFAYQPGGEVRTDFALLNDGPEPLTVLGVDWQSGPVFETATLRLPPGPSMGSVDGYPHADRPYWASEPFRPFVIRPGDVLTMVLSLGLRSCGGQSGVPLPAESGEPFAKYMPPAGSPKAYVGGVPIRYSVHGIEHRTLVLLGEVVAVVGAPGQLLGC